PLSTEPRPAYGRRPIEGKFPLTKEAACLAVSYFNSHDGGGLFHPGHSRSSFLHRNNLKAARFRREFRMGITATSCGNPPTKASRLAKVAGILGEGVSWPVTLSGSAAESVTVAAASRASARRAPPSA